MIVFAVNGVTNHIENALKTLNVFNAIDVLIVDTNSANNDIHNFYIENKNCYKFNIYYEKINYDCRDSGAYLYAINKYDYDTFYFFQDSVEFINDKIFIIINDLLYHPHSPVDVVAISPFKLKFDNEYQKQWSTEQLNIDDKDLINMNGIMGPMFSIKKETFNKIPKEWLKYPTNKIEACGMERRWSIIFHKLKFYVSFLEIYHELFLLGDNNNFLKKIVVRRK